MKKRLSLTIILILILSLFVFHPSIIKAQPIELKFAHYSPPGHPMLERIAIPWSKMVEEKAKGKLKITIYPAESLCKMVDTYDAVVSGVADIGYGLTQVTPGRFPLTLVITIPLAPWTTSSTLASQVAQKMYEEGITSKEFADVKLLFLYTIPPSTIFTIRPVRSMADAKGMKLVCYPRTAEGVALEALGFVPVSLPTPEIYLGLQRGVVEGCILTWESFVGRKIYEVAKYAIDLKMSTVPFYYIMNLKKWNSLPQDIKDAFNILSGMWGAKFAGQEIDAVNRESKSRILPMMKEIITLTPSELDRWYKVAEKGKDWWISSMEKRGLPAHEIYNSAIRITKEIK